MALMESRMELKRTSHSRETAASSIGLAGIQQLHYKQIYVKTTIKDVVGHNKRLKFQTLQVFLFSYS
jgi:hypothetical protein